jgi:two-component system phosphate regulon sensor histidine kinase PhoR
MMGVLIAIVAILVGVGIYMELIGRRAYDNAQRTTDLLLTERTVYSMLISMETGTRGYVITGDTQFLQPYNDSASQLPGLWTQLTLGITDLDNRDPTGNVGLGTLLDQTRAHAQSWQNDWADKEIELRGSGNVAEAMSSQANTRGKELFDIFRDSSQQLNAALSDRLRRYNTDLNNIRELELVMLVGLGLLALASGIITLRLSRREAALQDDTTRRVEAERQRLQDVIDNLPTGVRLLDANDGRIILQNQSADELFPPDEWNRMSGEERIAFFQMAKAGSTPMKPEELVYERANRDGSAVNDFEFSMVAPGDPTGRRRTFVASATPIRDASGAITSTVIVLQDVTRLKEIDQRKDEFIATAAHELRNPLAALSGYNQLIQRVMAKGNADPASIERNVREMGRQITRMNALVERLLDASRIQLGRIVLAPSTQDLVKMARNVVSEMQATEGASRMISLKAPEELTGCWDAVRLEQVLTNLLANAIRHTPANSPIYVKIEAQEGEKGPQARVEIVDEGPGIPADQRPHLFDRFYQTGALNSGAIGQPPPVKDRMAVSDSGSGAQRSTALTKKQGLGLGLYICYEIIKAHKGKIGVEPNPEGGSIFWFTIPRGDC